MTLTIRDRFERHYVCKCNRVSVTFQYCNLFNDLSRNTRYMIFMYTFRENGTVNSTQLEEKLIEIEEVCYKNNIDFDLYWFSFYVYYSALRFPCAFAYGASKFRDVEDNEINELSKFNCFIAVNMVIATLSLVGNCFVILY